MNKQQKPISEIMTRTLCQVGPHQTALDALTRMRSKSVSSVLVVENGAILGIITERDIVRAVHTHGNLRSMGCTELMQAPVVSVRPTTPCLEAYHKMTEQGIRHLAVTDDAEQVLGLASEGDLLRDFGIEYYMNFKNIGGVMRTDVCLISATAIVADAVEMMIENHQSCVLVVDNLKRPIGVLTERDVVRLCSDHAQAELLVMSDVMHSPVKTARSNGLLHEAVALMATAHIRRLVVVDDEGAICGVLTHHEIVRGLQNDYHDYFQELVDIQSRGLVRSAQPIDEKLILSTILGATSGTAVLASDLDHHIRHLNPAVMALLGLDTTETMGLDLRATMKRCGWPDADAVLCESALGAGPQTFQIVVNSIKIALRVFLMRDEQTRSCGYLVLAQRSVTQ